MMGDKTGYIIFANPQFYGQEDVLRQKAKDKVGTNPFFSDIDWETISVRLDPRIPEDGVYLMQDPFIQ